MAPRITKESETRNGYKYSLHFDGGGPVSSQEFVSVRPPEESEEEWTVTRWFYFDEQKDYYERNFAEKVCTDEQYRQQCIDETADWAVIANVFEPIEHELYESVYQNTDIEKKEFRKILQEVFTYVKREVRDNNRSELSKEEVIQEMSSKLVREHI